MIDFYDVADRTEAGNECRGGRNDKEQPQKNRHGVLILTCGPDHQCARYDDIEPEIPRQKSGQKNTHPSLESSIKVNQRNNPITQHGSRQREKRQCHRKNEYEGSKLL